MRKGRRGSCIFYSRGRKALSVGGDPRGGEWQEAPSFPAPAASPPRACRDVDRGAAPEQGRGGGGGVSARGNKKALVS